MSDRAPLRVLLIEDSPADAELIKLELESAFRIRALERVVDRPGLTTALDKPWDVILCDVTLPGFGAFEALELFTARDTDTPFVILSGTIGEEATVDLLKAGARDCVLKSNLPRLPMVVMHELAEAETRGQVRRAEAELRESEALLRLAVGGAGMVVWKWELRTGHMQFAGDVQRIFAVSAPTTIDELFGRVHPDDLPDMIASMDSARRGTSVPIDVRIVGEDGVLRWTSSWGDFLLDETGEVTAMVGATVDVTERRVAEEALRRTTGALETILASSPVAIMTADGDLRMTRWNPSAERMLGWRESEILGKRIPHVPPEDMEATARLIERAREGEPVANVETRRLRKDGSTVDVSLSLSALVDAHGEYAGILGMLLDISDQVEARQKLEESLEKIFDGDRQRRALLQRLVQAQEEERQRIAADIHDDSIQALTTLVLRLGLATAEVTDPRQHQALAQAEGAAREAIARLRHLIFELRPPELDQEGLAAALGLRLESLREETGIDYTIEDRADGCKLAPEARLVLYRIAQEALMNIRKHAGARTVRVELDCNDGQARVRIADDGSGLPAGAVDREERGHLGLAGMRERAEMAGGWWRISSEPGEGAVVEFAIPCGGRP